MGPVSIDHPVWQMLINFSVRDVRYVGILSPLSVMNEGLISLSQLVIFSTIVTKLKKSKITYNFFHLVKRVRDFFLNRIKSYNTFNLKIQVSYISFNPDINLFIKIEL